MSKVIKQCRVCGKNYEYCHTHRESTEFRWQEVSCSPECGNVYLNRILISRGLIPDTKSNNDVEDDENELLGIDYYDEFEDEEEADDFDEEDEEFDAIVNGK